MQFVPSGVHLLLQPGCYLNSSGPAVTARWKGIGGGGGGYNGFLLISCYNDVWRYILMRPWASLDMLPHSLEIYYWKSTALNLNIIKVIISSLSVPVPWSTLKSEWGTFKGMIEKVLKQPEILQGWAGVWWPHFGREYLITKVIYYRKKVIHDNAHNNKVLQ